MSEPRSTQQMWRPVRSGGMRRGAWLLSLTVVGMIASAAVVVRAEPMTSRLGGLTLLLGLMAYAGMILITLLRIQSMRYVFGPNALEVRSAVGRTRIRYEQIVDAQFRADAQSVAPTVWPGAHVGCADTEREHIEWHATSLDPRCVIWIAWGSNACALSPEEPVGFRRRLEELVATSVHPPVTAVVGRCGLLARVQRLDSWFRLLVLLGLTCGSVIAFIEVSSGGRVQPGSLIAVVALAVNTAVGAAVAPYSSSIARILAAGALAAMFIASVW